MNPSRTIRKLLIANRSEIASRIASTARMLGITTVALYTEEDKYAPFIFETHEAYQLPKKGYEGYTCIEDIIACAHQCEADAIHPGYGFLSESPIFAQAVIDAGLLWVGPRPEAIEKMGSKIQARKTMQEAGVPIVPGFYFNAEESSAKEKAYEAYRQLQGPALLKASAGGGGKGMHVVSDHKDFSALWDRTVRESRSLFNSSELLLEKYIPKARHIEVQIAGDGKNFIHLFERECSIQRRHQKLIEEAPCSFITSTTREKLYSYALRAAQAIAYDSIGTVEFLVTDDETIYFLEMNTRIQVEHPITELVTGIDLVDLQLEIAQTKKVPYSQTDISVKGHSIECRIIAENPLENFIPSTGTLINLSLPKSPFMRIDHTLEKGYEVTPFFDSMIAKISTYGETREKSRARMIDCLSNCNIQGIKTNLSLLHNILSNLSFQHGHFSTKWLEENLFTLLPSEPKATTAAIVTAALFLSLLSPKKNVSTQRWVQRRWK
jgi:acetyl-CoA carboxylase biotin carboxylase subunit